MKAKIAALFVAIALCGIAIPSIAEDNLYSREYKTCIDNCEVAGQADECVRNELTRLDKKLNTNYKKVMSLIGKKTGKKGQNAFRQAQQTWLKWRDQEFAFFNIFEWGLAGDRINMGYCLEKTAQRVRFLEELIEHLTD